MKETSKTARNSDRKKKVLATTAMLLVAATVLIAVSYAWLVLSIAPEVSGISTQIGANGALEIALLNNVTHADLSQISSGIGNVGNNTWRNIVELGSEEYGLSNITLYPARLNITGNAENGYKLNNGAYLSVPEYDYSGVVTKLTDDTYGVTYDSTAGAFVGNLADPDYGVRGFGTAGGLSVREAAIALAKSNVSTYSGRAKTSASNTLGGFTDDLLSLILSYSTDASKVYTDAEIECLGKIINGLKESYSYIDLSIRQGIIAYAASITNNDKTFEDLKAQIESMSGFSVVGISVPDSIKNLADKAEALDNNIKAAENGLHALKADKSGAYLWSDIRPIMDLILDMNKIYLGDNLFAEMSKEDLMSLMGKNFNLSLPAGSGAFADIADFTGNYYSNVSAMGSYIKVETLSTQSPAYLTSLSSFIGGLDGGSNSSSGDIVLSNIYGYAIDLGFRCNAPLSELLLQTGAISRISQDDPDDDVPGSGASTMGAGSFMEFTTDSKTFTTEQMIALMDAIRVAFVDSKDNVLGIAKLNVSNRTIIDNVISAPLYLYEYSLVADPDAGGNILKMGARRQKDDNVITPLEQNVAEAVTVLVWLDGDIVDNTMVASDSKTSLNGVLNLQFSSSADLVPAEHEYLKNLSPDKKTLSEKITESTEIYDAGQQMYSTETWEDFVNAYNYATKIYNNDSSTEAQVLKATKNLVTAKQALSALTVKGLREKVDELRKFMGKTDEVARAIIEENGTIKVVSSYDRETEVSGYIYHVNDANNLTNTAQTGVMIPIYTAYSWNTLAQALYEAEALCLLPDYANAVNIDAAISAIEDAKNTLIPYFTKTAYEFNGATYYRADVESDDIYGLWYDEYLNVVTSDVMILRLEANAESVKMAKIDGIDNYIPLGENGAVTELYPSIKFTYPDGITEEDILAIQWSVSTGDYVLAMTSSQKNLLVDLISDAKNIGVTAEAIEAEQIFSVKPKPSSEAVAEVINSLKDVYDRYVYLNKLVEKAEELNLAKFDPMGASKLNSAKNLLTPSASKVSTLTQVNKEIEILSDSIYAAIQVKNQKKVLSNLIETAKALDVEIESAQSVVDKSDATLDDVTKGIESLRDAIHLECRKLTLANLIDEARRLGKTEEADAAEVILTGETVSLYVVNAEIVKLEEAIPGDESYLVVVEPEEKEVEIEEADIEFTQITLPGDFTYADLIFMEDNQILYLYQPVEEEESGKTNEGSDIIDPNTPSKPTNPDDEGKSEKANEGSDIIDPNTPSKPTNPDDESGDSTDETTEPEEKVVDYTGKITLTAVVLTKDGYVCTIEKVVTVYKAASLKEPVSESISVNAGSSKVAEVQLVNDPDYAIGEQVKNYVWSTDDAEIATIVANDATCAIKGVKSGTTTVRVTVYTIEGNAYTKTFTVTVK